MLCKKQTLQMVSADSSPNLRRRLVRAAFSHDFQVKAYVSSQVVCVSVEEGELIWAKGQLLHRAAKVNGIVQQFGL